MEECKMKKEMVLANKGELQGFRKEMKAKGFTEIKLLYRAGQYVLTYLTETVDKFGLMASGWMKPSKEFKEYAKANRLKVYSKVSL
jgi:hypothetical protein